MRRLSVSTRLAFAAVTLTSAVTLAETNESGEPGAPAPVVTGRRIAIPTPLEMYATPHAQISNTIYLERCQNPLNCMIVTGPNDARGLTSTIPQRPTSNIGE